MRKSVNISLWLSESPCVTLVAALVQKTRLAPPAAQTYAQSAALVIVAGWGALVGHHSRSPRINIKRRDTLFMAIDIQTSGRTNDLSIKHIYKKCMI